MNILLVDDTMTMRILMTAILEDFGHQVVSCDNGEQAVERYLAERPDLILMDVVMPVVDGYQAARKIRALDEEWVPIIFLSTRAEPADVATGIEAGGDDYLTKPVDETILRAKLVAMQRIAKMRHRLIEVSRELENANSVLQRQAEVDGLTGLANRRLLDRHLAKEIARCTRTHSPLSVIMADIDHFKAFNDHYGHIAGDNCLQKVSNTLTGLISRSNDLACRYGGEEFCIVLPDTNLEGVSHVADRLRVRVERLKIEHAVGGGKVTLSLGTCTSIPDQNCSAEQLIACADKALYEAKQRGRNRVVSFEQTPQD
jgi:diguanylate cyclase (GGDEF)-like protein